jgi:hypothetical protein
MLLSQIAAAVVLAQTASAPTEVTVYNGGFGFVKEVRTLNLQKGIQTVPIEDVAAQIETNSVGIRSLTDPNSFAVLEQNYQFDLINAMAILNKAVGGTIRLHRVLPNGTKEVLEGTLMSSPTAIVNTGDGGSGMTYNGMVLKTADGRIFLNPSGEIEVQSIPEGMISRPTLLWMLDSDRAGPNQVELSYLTQGMSWASDYVMTIDGAGKADFRGWVTLVNNCGKSFKDARLKLIAGDVLRAQPQNAGFAGGRGGGGFDRKAAESFQEESLFEYHLYTLQRPATVRNNEQKQVSLLEASGIPYEKKLIVDSMLNFGMYYPSEGEVGTGDIKPLVKVEFVNKKDYGLGVPLPKGRVKVYQRDKSGSVQMVGEDNIDHTPKDERVSLTVGRSFDIRATRKRTNFKRIDYRSFEETFEIEVRNRKEVADKVYVYERHYAEWEIPKTSMEYTKLDSQTMQYLVELKANETKTITYTVITRW